MTATIRANRHPGPCADCGHPVAAGAGRLDGSRDTGWTVRHLDGQCNTTPAPAPAAPAAPALRRNMFPGDCTACNQRIPANAGQAVRGSSGWTVRHIGDCPAPPPPPAATGIYRTADGIIWRVRPARGQKDVPADRQRRTLARLVDSHVDRYTEAGSTVRFDWEWDESGMIYELTPEMLVPLDDEAVKAMMIATGQCIACDAALYSERTMKQIGRASCRERV
jgi:hypothetical protein